MRAYKRLREKYGKMDLKKYLSEKKALVDNALESYFTVAEGLVSNVVEAMKYSLLGEGKRIRPILCMAGAEAVGGKALDVLPAACALEMIHAYSLIHDDLPVMDNDDLRRGKPTNHKVFGEATAVLAGDGLLTEAFNALSASDLAERIPPRILLKVINIIAQASGYQGMVGGQAVDIQSEGKEVPLSVVEFIHRHKTGALITAAVFSGALIGGGDNAQVQAIAAYGKNIGLAFQISDDILNVEGSSEIIGKSVGSDNDKGKVTYPGVLGLMRSKTIEGALIQAALESLEGFDDRANPLRQIARYIVERKK